MKQLYSVYQLPPVCVCVCVHTCTLLLQTLCSGGSHPRSVQLTHRSLVRVCGVDSGTFLQGLVTADVSTLKDSGALYSMILNAQVS